jgi:hypothetical protein
MGEKKRKESIVATEARKGDLGEEANCEFLVRLEKNGTTV